MFHTINSSDMSSKTEKKGAPPLEAAQDPALAEAAAEDKHDGRLGNALESGLRAGIRTEDVEVQRACVAFGIEIGLLRRDTKAAEDHEERQQPACGG